MKRTIFENKKETSEHSVRETTIVDLYLSKNTFCVVCGVSHMCSASTLAHTLSIVSSVFRLH